MSAVRRLAVEFKGLMDRPTEGILAGPVSSDSFMEWECLVSGPVDTPFEGGVFRAVLNFPTDYPLSPVSWGGGSSAAVDTWARPVRWRWTGCYQDSIPSLALFVCCFPGQPKLRFTSSIWHPNIYGPGPVRGGLLVGPEALVVGMVPSVVRVSDVSN